MLKKIRTTELGISSSLGIHIEGSLRGTEGEDTVGLGDLGSGLDVPEDRVLVELAMSLGTISSKTANIPQSRAG
jgi:hypothetical protein